MIRRLSAVVVAIVILGPSLPVSRDVFADDCEDCKPSRLNQNTNLSGNYSVCIQSDATYQFSSSEEQAMAHGIQQYWGNYFATAANINFNISTGTASNPCSGDITISIDPGMSTSNYGTGNWGEADLSGGDGRGSEIRVNPDLLGCPYCSWEWFGAHEMGHLMDYADKTSPSGCENYSIMAYGTQYLNPSADWLRCADALVCSERWVEPDFGGEEDYTPNGDCWDVYWVQITYCWNGNWWVQCGQIWTWLYEDCDPRI